jgi:hypothetical protein
MGRKEHSLPVASLRASPQNFSSHLLAMNFWGDLTEKCVIVHRNWKSHKQRACRCYSNRGRIRLVVRAFGCIGIATKIVTTRSLDDNIKGPCCCWGKIEAETRTLGLSNLTLSVKECQQVRNTHTGPCLGCPIKHANVLFDYKSIELFEIRLVSLFTQYSPACLFLATHGNHRQFLESRRPSKCWLLSGRKKDSVHMTQGGKR